MGRDLQHFFSIVSKYSSSFTNGGHYEMYACDLMVVACELGFVRGWRRESVATERFVGCCLLS